MGRRNRIVRPKTKRLDISDGDWILVKEELNAGEYRDMLQACAKETPSSDVPEFDQMKLGFEMIEAYLVDWSLEDEIEGENGETTVVKLELTPETICALDFETFQEIQSVISEHVNASAEEKKAQTGKPKQEQTLAS